MTFRRLVLTLLLGGGLALVALPAASASATAYPPHGGPTGSASSSSVTVFVGDPVNFTGCGFVPGSTIHVTLDGVPNRTIVASAQGCFALRYVFRSVGSDVLVATGADPGGGTRTVTLFVTVKPRTAGGTLPFTGSDIAALAGGGVALLGGGFLLLSLTRRRRTADPR